MEPCRGHDIGASLLFEKNCQPERQVGAVWRAKLRSRALLFIWLEDEGKGSSRYMEWLTERSSMLSRRWRGTTVTSSISHRKAASEGTRPRGRGKAMVWVVVMLVTAWGVMSCSASKLRVSRVENVVPLHRGIRTTHPPIWYLDLLFRSRHLP